MVQRRKLIEVALPLEAINRESAREKSIRHGHPSTLHLWWARRPLAAARAVLFAQLVDDPSSNPKEFPTEELQRKERDRLHRLIERLVVWENIRDDKLLAEAHAEILKSTGGNPPPVLDPFAGGGTIPLEAQRLGLEAHASDLNPVAVLINKALIEIPPKFRNQPPVFPGLAESEIRSWSGSAGLATDVRAYAGWLRDEAKQRLALMYPDITSADGSTATPIAWVWTRTITCPNPACGIDMPLVRSWWLSKKRSQECYVVPSLVDDRHGGPGRQVHYGLGFDPALGPAPEADGTVNRRGARCVGCNSPVDLKYVRSEGKAKRIGNALMAVVAEGTRRRLYMAPSSEQFVASQVERPHQVPPGSIFDNPRNFNTTIYGLTEFSDLFTNRQLVTLCTFSDLALSARELAIEHGATEDYANAIATYLGLAISRLADRNNTICTWDSGPVGSKSSTGGSARTASIRNAFARQAIPMTWDFAEANPFSSSGGSFESAIDWVVPAIERLNGSGLGTVRQADARTAVSESGVVISTDPPYYDNIGYADLSDFFYVWLRRSLRSIYPTLLATLLVPKAEELVANPYRHGGKDVAKNYFEEGFQRVFARARDHSVGNVPITVWYAFKQRESDPDGSSSSGWETLLEGMIRSGWEITSTWPNRSEMSNRMIAAGTNALASSIVLSLRPRSPEAPTVDRRSFISALEGELPDALRKLQQGQIAPVDLPQAAIGPGMSVFSRYAAVLEPDGTHMSVRSALARINEILDQVLNEQEGDFDSTSRFAIAWYRQHGYSTGSFGDANNLANARNTTVDNMDRDGILSSRAGKVHLIKPSDLTDDYDVLADLHTSNWEVLHHLIKTLEGEGITPAGEFLRTALSRPHAAIDADLVKELAHLLFRVAESNGWTKDALSFNSLVTSWPEIIDVARSEQAPVSTQGAFDYAEED